MVTLIVRWRDTRSLYMHWYFSSTNQKKQLRNICDLNLIAIWRHLKPNKKEYSCLSNTYKTYSRIDYFLISGCLLSSIEKCWYDSVLLSDHVPISLILQVSNIVTPPPRYRFQSRSLQNPDFVKWGENRFTFNTYQISAAIK